MVRCIIYTAVHIWLHAPYILQYTYGYMHHIFCSTHMVICTIYTAVHIWLYAQYILQYTYGYMHNIYCSTHMVICTIYTAVHIQLYAPYILQYTHITSHSGLPKIRNFWEKICFVIQSSHFMFSTFLFFPKSCHLWDNVEQHGRAGQATRDNMALAQVKLHNQGYKHTLTILNTYWFTLQQCLHGITKMLH